MVGGQNGWQFTTQGEGSAEAFVADREQTVDHEAERLARARRRRQRIVRALGRMGRRLWKRVRH